MKNSGSKSYPEYHYKGHHIFYSHYAGINTCGFICRLHGKQQYFRSAAAAQRAINENLNSNPRPAGAERKNIMEKYTINQIGAGNYEIEAESEDAAIRDMAEAIVNQTEDWENQYATESFDEAIEKASQTLSVVITDD